MSGVTTPSPTGSGGDTNCSLTERSGVYATEQQHGSYTTESEAYTPTKEEMETNQKNLHHNASYLGQLIFKLR